MNLPLYSRFQSVQKQSPEKGVLTTFANFTGKHLESLFPVAPVQLLSSEFCKIFKITYFVEHLFCRKKKKEKQTLFSVRIRMYRSEEKHNFLNIFIDKYETLPGFQ